MTLLRYIHSPTGDTTQLHSTPLRGGGGQRANIAITFGTEKLKMVVYHAGGERTKCDDMFSRVDTIRVCNTVKV